MHVDMPLSVHACSRLMPLYQLESLVIKLDGPESRAQIFPKVVAAWMHFYREHINDFEW